MTESFYNNIAALKERDEVATSHRQANYSSTDLNGWIMEHLAPRTNDTILDLGTGSGKQALLLARTVKHPGYILTIDRSYETLNRLSQHSLEAGLETRIRFLQIPLDELDGHLRREDFDRAVSSRVLSHLRQPRTVFHALALALKPGGLFFFYGPSRKNNAEIKRFSARLQGDFSAQESQDPTFIEGAGLQGARDVFSQVAIVKFEQTLRLDSPEMLYACWSASSLYDETLDRSFRQAALRHFESHTVFETTQRIIGIKATR
jgi:2-polyprenyl-3-methyl-5-hydroxy-6-metoxy-1,4-benzoquinol methylase